MANGLLKEIYHRHRKFLHRRIPFYPTISHYAFVGCSHGKAMPKHTFINIQSSNYIGFWCDWSNGDGAVMMIGGGGSACDRADHGVGITEEDQAKFGGSTPRHDFGYNVAPSTYSFNLWVR
ncbi:uncharacterized protein LOC114545129 [Dendronephthya gigantea]|uniref:uncharacterized protein LOC114545129 n=1 Tax=Dendronephthya gigantea TaxID=151771 RepID=UPI001068F102|nr:uncharacterized protein LOC114545129 [Dendronephthya gigantea]